MSKIANAHFFRITRPYSECNKIFETMASQASYGRIIVFEHTAPEFGARTHIHAYVERTCSRDSIRNAIKAVVGKLERSDWTFTDVKNDDMIVIDNPIDGVIKMITYMTKGCLFPKFMKGFDESDVLQAQQMWVVPTKPINHRQTMDDIKNVTEKRVDNRFTRKDIVKLIADDLIEDKRVQLGWLKELTEEDKRELIGMYTNKEVMDYTLKVLWACDIIPGAYKYLDYAIGVRMFYNSERRENTIYSNMIGKMDAGLYKL